MSKQGIRAVLLSSMLATVACAPGAEQRTEEPAKPTVVTPTTADGEVYYFPAVGADYRASLSAFRKAHPELRCRYFGADDTEIGLLDNRYATIVGHTVVCTDIAQNAQEETVP